MVAGRIKNSIDDLVKELIFLKSCDSPVKVRDTGNVTFMFKINL